MRDSSHIHVALIGIWEGLHNPPPNPSSGIWDNHINTPIKINMPTNILAE